MLSATMPAYDQHSAEKPSSQMLLQPLECLLFISQTEISCLSLPIAAYQSPQNAAPGGWETPEEQREGGSAARRGKMVEIANLVWI